MGLNNENSIAIFYPLFKYNPFATFYWSAAFFVTIRRPLKLILGFTDTPRGTKSLFQEANKLLEEAKSLFEEAKSLFKEAKSLLEMPNWLLEEANKLLQEAKSLLEVPFNF